MNDKNTAALKTHLQKRFRRARLLFAARAPIYFIPLVAFASLVGGLQLQSCLACALACALVAFGLYKGRPYERAGLAGTAIGTIPSVVAALAMPLMSAGNDLLCQALCTWGSAFAAFAFVIVLGRGISPLGLLFGGIIVLCLAPIGCAAMTLGGALGFAGGAALALPIPLWFSARANN